MLSKVFKAYDIRGLYPDALTEKVAWKVGAAAGRFLRAQLLGRDASDPMLNHVVVGRDMRTHSPKLAKALMDGLRASGANVLDIGMVDTAFIYFAINHLNCGGGIQTTASHNPSEYNGFKISKRHAQPVGQDTGLIEIQRIAATLDAANATTTGLVEERDLWDDYAEHVLQFLDLGRPLKVVVDASNGMAGAFLPKIFENIPDLNLITLNTTMNGKFVHDPNPLVPENMVPTREAVLKHKADFGVCFDGDADRCILCDEKGQAIGCDLLGALFAQYFLEQEPEAPVIYDLRSSKALPETVTRLGGTPIRGKVGHVFMKELMREHNAIFGAELSGHMYYRDNFYTDSGPITFATALTIASQSKAPMSKLIAPFTTYKQSGELNFKVDPKSDNVKALAKSLKRKASLDDLDGTTADAWDKEGWWLNVRPSNTEPFIRFNLEARDEQTLEKMLSKVTPILGDPLKGH